MNRKQATRTRTPIRTGRRTTTAIVLTLCLLFSALLSTEAGATEHRAHWHYMVGARANMAANFCKALHHEATQPGPLYMETARSAATDLEKLAAEILYWVEETERVHTPEENKLIQGDLEAMRSEATRMAEKAKELRLWIEDAESEGRTEALHDDETIRELRDRVAQRAAVLFYGFSGILKAHKRAEMTLGIPVPAAPPIPADG